MVLSSSSSSALVFAFFCALPPSFPSFSSCTSPSAGSGRVYIPSASVSPSIRKEEDANRGCSKRGPPPGLPLQWRHELLFTFYLIPGIATQQGHKAKAAATHLLHIQLANCRGHNCARREAILLERRAKLALAAEGLLVWWSHRATQMHAPDAAMTLRLSPSAHPA